MPPNQQYPQPPQQMPPNQHFQHPMPNPMPPQKNNNSTVIIIVGVVAFIFIVLIIIGIFSASRSNDTQNETSEEQTSQQSEDSAETEETGETTNTQQKPDNPTVVPSNNNQVISVSNGDYTIDNITDLEPVCTDNSFPSGVQSSSSGKITAVLKSHELPPEKPDYNYYSAAGEDFSTDGYSTNVVDNIICVNMTDEVIFEIPCTIRETNFTTVGYKFNATAYNIHSQQAVGTTTINSERRCPLFAVLDSNNQDIAITIDRDELYQFIRSL